MDKCEKRMLSSFSVLEHRLSACKFKQSDQSNKDTSAQEVLEMIAVLNSGEESALRRVVRNTIHASSKSQEYYIDGIGHLYEVATYK